MPMTIALAMTTAALRLASVAWAKVSVPLRQGLILGALQTGLQGPGAE